MPLPKIVKTRGFFFSAVLHLAIIIFLVIGIEPSHKLAPMESNKPLMKARAVNLSAIEADKKRKADALAVEQKAALEKRLAEEKKLKDEQDKKTEQAEQIKQENLAQQKKLKQEKERKEQQKQVQQEKAKEKEIAKQKAAKEKELTEKKRQEELKRKKEAEALAAKKKEDEKKAQEEKARQKKAKEEKARQKALDDALAEEEREMAQAQQKAADDSEIAKHIRSIAARVSAAFSYPPGLEEGLSCTLYVRMIPGGEVIEATVRKSSGSATFDRQAENAVRKASPLPVPDEPRLFSRMREIQFTFDPNN